MINKFGKGAVFKIPTVFRPGFFYLWKGPLKRLFFAIYLTTCFGGHKFKYASAMRVIFVLRMFKIKFGFPKSKKLFGKSFFVSEINTSEDVAINCVY